MATISAADVKRLREATNAGIMDCKRALAEVDGDFDKAVTYLREKGIAGAGKKAGRATGEGLIGVHVSADGKTAGIIEVNCETDFVARNDNFRELVSGLAQQVEKGANSVEELSAQTFADSGKTVEEHVRESIATIGENIVLQRLERLEAKSGVLGSYVHSDGKQAAVVEISTSTADEKATQLARDLAMQVVALRPEFVGRDDVPSDRVDAERAIYEQQAAQEGKPEAIQTKIAEGRLSKEFFQTVALTEQMFVKEQKQSIAQLLKQHGDAQVVRFVRFRVGEGLQLEETEVEA